MNQCKADLVHVRLIESRQGKQKPKQSWELGSQLVKQLEEGVLGSSELTV